ncbi:DUF2975 domain-containing protein [Listeria seeligeri]|uniref:DUF2975 domain-containing protein n=1 Tax=Listeria seeligeri TaxID=1640 RepID=UPI001623E0AB|nr:DUF2975 domain-containing protein [Listeria seeligeri]MBC1534024.1 DUF2975 domain-containing protein [Listeria seeligeri]MBC1739438.1 DUF2975 domain-containing protein [Listeria seeligeri]MBC1745059.1 DUF2975 domain-containing protein [Listeria seeligeri]MBC1747901.1 DUF2975 domain-containing protein [Listeria seeligeri]MBC1820404.1 DUF2975 domain-containing protein [Listeria seeligeri]
MKLKRLQKMSYLLHIALKIFSIGTIVMLISSVLMKLLNKNNVSINMVNENEYTFFNFQTEFIPGSDTEQYKETEQWILLGVAVFSFIILAVLLWIASMIFKDLATNFAPFSEIGIIRLRRISQLLLIYSVVPQILYSILHKIIIPGYYFSLGLNMSLLFAIIFYCLTEIFRYGAFLQKESDETL